MAQPNGEELDAIVEFRERMKDVLTGDQLADEMFLIRWIRAREMNLEKAEEMLRNALKWRQEKKVDSLLRRKVDPFISQNYPRWIDGVDKQGQPIYAAAFGQWDLRKAIAQGLIDQFLEYTTEGFERLLLAIQESNEQRSPQQSRVTQIVAIFDFEGFAWGQLLNYKAISGLLQLGGIYEAYYPEILHSCYFINCPSLISRVLSLLKPILAPKTMDKIKCFGSDRGEWQSELLKVIEADQLRPQFGGTQSLIPSSS